MHANNLFQLFVPDGLSALLNKEIDDSLISLIKVCHQATGVLGFVIS
jgi:hypothetical protein